MIVVKCRPEGILDEAGALNFLNSSFSCLPSLKVFLDFEDLSNGSVILRPKSAFRMLSMLNFKLRSCSWFCCVWKIMFWWWCCFKCWKFDGDCELSRDKLLKLVLSSFLMLLVRLFVICDIALRWEWIFWKFMALLLLQNKLFPFWLLSINFDGAKTLDDRFNLEASDGSRSSVRIRCFSLLKTEESMWGKVVLILICFGGERRRQAVVAPAPRRTIASFGKFPRANATGWDAGWSSVWSFQSLFASAFEGCCTSVSWLCASKRMRSTNCHPHLQSSYCLTSDCQRSLIRFDRNSIYHRRPFLVPPTNHCRCCYNFRRPG